MDNLTEKERELFKDPGIEAAYVAWEQTARPTMAAGIKRSRKDFLMRIRFLFQSGQL